MPVTDDARDAVERLLRLLDLEEVEVDLYRGHNPEAWPGGRVFGGLVAAQALRAAIATVEVEHFPHSLHAHFLRPGRQGLPIVYEVDRVRDGRSFTTRYVTARQRGEVIFTLTGSFHRQGEESTDYQLPRDATVPTPEAVADGTGLPVSSNFFSPFQMRDVGPSEPEADGTYRSTRRVWVRTATALPDDPVIHTCVLTFMSDMAVVLAVRPPTGGTPWEGFTGASLDHAVWFHRPARADAWLLYDLHSVSFANARGVARGVFHQDDGTLVASVTQESLIRTLRPAAAPPPEARPPEL